MNIAECISINKKNGRGLFLVRKILYYFFIALVMCAIWVILMEDLSIWNISAGFFLGCISLTITDRIMHLDYYSSVRSINPLIFIKYIFYLIFQIYSAGFSTIRRIITGRVNVGIVDVNTILEDDLHIAVLANSITLTPGTVSIDKQGQNLKVLCIDCKYEKPENAGRRIKKEFENILSGEK
jgi:multicomponent Na+:H+ antiporter subunit E